MPGCHPACSDPAWANCGHSPEWGSVKWSVSPKRGQEGVGGQSSQALDPGNFGTGLRPKIWNSKRTEKTMGIIKRAEKAEGNLVGVKDLFPS